MLGIQLKFTNFGPKPQSLGPTTQNFCWNFQKALTVKFSECLLILVMSKMPAEWRTTITKDNQLNRNQLMLQNDITPSQHSWRLHYYSNQKRALKICSMITSSSPNGKDWTIKNWSKWPKVKRRTTSVSVHRFICPYLHVLLNNILFNSLVQTWALRWFMIWFEWNHEMIVFSTVYENSYRKGDRKMTITF